MAAKRDDKDLDPIELAPTDTEADESSGELGKKPSESPTSDTGASQSAHNSDAVSDAAGDEKEIPPEQVIELESESDARGSVPTSKTEQTAKTSSGREVESSGSESTTDGREATVSGDEDDAGEVYDLDEPSPVDDPGAMRNVLLDEVGEDEEPDTSPTDERGADEAGEVPGQPKFRSDSQKARKRAEQRARHSEQMKAEYQRKRKKRLIVGGVVLLVLAVVYLLFFL